MPRFINAMKLAGKTATLPLYNKYGRGEENPKKKKSNWLIRKIRLYIIFGILGIIAITIAIMIMEVSITGDKMLDVYMSLTMRTSNSKSNFDKKLMYINRDENGNVSVTIGYKGDVNETVQENLITEAQSTGTTLSGGSSSGSSGVGGVTVTSTSVNIEPSSGDVVIDDWLVLHSSPSSSGGTIQGVPSVTGMNQPTKWSMGEGNTLKQWNVYTMGLYDDKSYARPSINGVVADHGEVNSSGRYWVAIGPAWFNPGLINTSTGFANSSKAPTAGGWFADGIAHNFDLIVTYNGSTYYIYCCLGDSKAHTYREGMGYIQSGVNWNGSEDLSDKHKDYSIVEWCGVDPSVGASLGSVMKLDGLVKY